MWIPTLAQLAERRTVDVIEFLRSLVRLRQVGSFFILKKKERRGEWNNDRKKEEKKNKKKENE